MRARAEPGREGEGGWVPRGAKQHACMGPTPETHTKKTWMSLFDHRVPRGGVAQPTSPRLRPRECVESAWLEVRRPVTAQRLPTGAVVLQRVRSCIRCVDGGGVGGP